MITVGGSYSNGVTNKMDNYIKDLEYKFHIIIVSYFKEENIKELLKLQMIKKQKIINKNVVEKLEREIGKIQF